MPRCCVATWGIGGSPAGFIPHEGFTLHEAFRPSPLLWDRCRQHRWGALKVKFPDRAGRCPARSQRAQLRSKIQGFVVALFSKSRH